jgi:SnoaL-like domain
MIAREKAGRRTRADQRSAYMRADVAQAIPFRCLTSPSSTSPRRWSASRHSVGASSTRGSDGRSAETPREVHSGWPASRSERSSPLRDDVHLHAQPAGPKRSAIEHRAIENLIATYAELVDDGDFAGVGILLADATFRGSAGSVSGRGAIEKMLRDSLIVYDDGTPRTRHFTTNVLIEVDEQAGTAFSRSYFTALQALPDLALQPSSAVGMRIASSVATGNGASRSGVSEPTSSTT